MSNFTLHVTGEVARPLEFDYHDLAGLPSHEQIPDLSRLDSRRAGGAVRLAGLLDQAGVKGSARWLTLHSSTDDFHASIPLADVRERAILIYSLDGAPLPASQGGPVRFFIPDHAACNAHEIDECANVKFVDHLELTAERGHDNRPHDEAEHAALHERERRVEN